MESTKPLSEILDDLALFDVPRKPTTQRRVAARGPELPPMSDDEFWSRGESTTDATNVIEI